MVNAPHIRLVLWKAAKAVEKVDRASIAATGLHLSDFQILEILLHKGPLPINAIGEKVLLTSGSMTAATRRLEKKGLVKRIQDSCDGRCFNIHLTPAGRIVIEKAYTVHEKNLERVVSALASAERGELVRLLKKLGCNADQLTPMLHKKNDNKEFSP
jgi:MarR family transcriptional regulator, 2-MHQ and catechol-resistance regulon repressor